MGFINTIDVLGDDVVADSIIEGTIAEFRDESVTMIGAGAFAECKSLALVDVPNVTNIASAAFQWETALRTLILRGNSVCKLDTTAAFTGTPIQTSSTAGAIFVPDNLVNTYKSATNWSTFAAKIKPLSELEE